MRGNIPVVLEITVVGMQRALHAGKIMTKACQPRETLAAIGPRVLNSGTGHERELVGVGKITIIYRIADTALHDRVFIEHVCDTGIARCRVTRGMRDAGGEKSRAA